MKWYASENPIAAILLKIKDKVLWVSYLQYITITIAYKN